eukprot:3082289-Ditylum_brightwellii.AAC.1
MSMDKSRPAECVRLSSFVMKTDQAIKDLRNVNFDSEDKGDIEDYLGMTIEKLSDGRIRITQPHIIQSIIDEMSDMETNLSGEGPEKMLVCNSYKRQLPPTRKIIWDLDTRPYFSVYSEAGFYEISSRRHQEMMLAQPV